MSEKPSIRKSKILASERRKLRQKFIQKYPKECYMAFYDNPDKEAALNHIQHLIVLLRKEVYPDDPYNITDKIALDCCYGDWLKSRKK